MSEQWKVGRANDPHPEDAVYDSEAAAVERAQKMADAYGFYTPVGVWDERDRPAWLFMLGEQFRRV